MRNFMASFNFLDDIGLRNLVDNIIQNFSTKSQTEDNRKALSDRIEEVYQHLLNALGEETSRAMASELELKNLILEEIERAESSESSIIESLNTESNRAQEVESQIKASVDAEVARAMESESVLSKGIGDLRTSLTEEINRASNAEENLKTSIESTSSKLDSEIERAKDSESSIIESLNTESDRAQEAESQIKASIDAEVSRATESESVLSKGIEDLGVSLTEEINRASNAEENLKTSIESTSSKLDSEIERAKESESMIASDLTQLGEELRSKDSAIEEELSSVSNGLEETKETLTEVGARVTSLEGRVDTLEEQVADGAGAVKDVLMDGVSIVRDRIAYIKKGDITGEGSASILTYPTIEDFPTSESEVPPNFITLYLALDTKILYKWDGDSYSELGKSNIIVTDSLPSEGVEDVLYVKTPDYLIYQWANGSYREIGGKDEDLRNEFIIHKSSLNPHNITKDTVGLSNVDNTSDLDKPISTAVQEALNALGNTLDTGLTTASEELRTHVRNKENPHNVTAELLGLGLVDNTRDLEKPVSYAVKTALEGKVSYEDIKDTLASTETSKALSARQGSVLDGKISEINGTILSIGSVFHFKGTLSSEADLETVDNPVQGDAWQIRILDESGKDTSGIVFAYTDNGWVEISASVSDISNYIATTDDVYSIIDAY